jgi:hypothetical protein
VQQGVSAITSPVLELVIGMYLEVFDSFHVLSMQYFNLSIVDIIIASLNLQKGIG